MLIELISSQKLIVFEETHNLPEHFAPNIKGICFNRAGLIVLSLAPYKLALKLLISAACVYISISSAGMRLRKAAQDGQTI
jgi:hypothetical protein